MNFLGFIVLFLYVCKCASEKAYNLRFRNTLLRLYIATDKKKVIGEYSDKIVKKTQSKANDYYNKVLMKCYDVNLFYNSLTDEEKELIDFIISLIY
jgi:hypothetical protein